MDFELLAERVQELCQGKKMTVNDMLLDAGLSKNTLVNIKNGSTPGADKLLAIANYFDVSIDYLIGKTDNPKGIYVENVSELTLKSMEIMEKLPDEQKQAFFNMLNTMAKK